jgi:hypothetical protein
MTDSSPMIAGDDRQKSLETLMNALKLFSRDELQPRHRTILRSFVFTDEQRAAMVQSTKKANNKRYATDPEYRTKHNACTNAASVLRYANDEVFREKTKADRRERYARQKAERAESLAQTEINLSGH